MSEEHIPGGLDDADNNDFVQVDPEEPGPLQKVSTTSSTSSRKTQDVAYKQASRTVDESLAAGLSNEDVWMLIRRFNKVRTLNLYSKGNGNDGHSKSTMSRPQTTLPV